MLLLIGLTITTLSALLEEVVWRGYYHTYLRKSYSFNQTAFIVACIWMIWHLPIALLYKEYSNASVGIISYLLILFVTSYFLTLLRELSDSVWPAALCHGMLNVFYFSDGLMMQAPLHHIEMTKLMLLTILISFVFIISRKVLGAITDY